MGLAEEARKNQVRLVGSETLYTRLDQKLTDLEVDPFFYHLQCKLFGWRCHLVGNTFTIVKRSFLMTKGFASVIEKIDSPDFVHDTPDIPLSIEALYKFMIPTFALQHFCQIDLHSVKEEETCKCNVYIKAIDKGLISYFPESVKFVDFAIQSLSIRSLKDLCMGRVVELGLPQDCLPLSVQDSIRKGPELGDVDRRTQRGLEMLQDLKL